MFGKAMMLCTPAALGGLYYTGHLGAIGGQSFDVPAQTAYERIAYMPMPPQMKESGGQVIVDRVPGESVTWNFMKRGSEVMEITATLSPMAGGKAVNISTDIDIKEDNPHVQKSGVVFYEMEANSFFVEQLASRVEARPFNKKAANDRAMGYVMANMGKIQGEIGAQLEKASREFDTMDGPSYRSGPSAAAKPTTDLSRYR